MWQIWYSLSDVADMISISTTSDREYHICHIRQRIPYLPHQTENIISATSDREYHICHIRHRIPYLPQQTDMPDVADMIFYV
jgi:hypothetical protein